MTNQPPNLFDDLIDDFGKPSDSSSMMKEDALLRFVSHGFVQIPRSELCEAIEELRMKVLMDDVTQSDRILLRLLFACSYTLTARWDPENKTYTNEGKKYGR